AVDLRAEIQRLLASAEQGRTTTTHARTLGRILFEPLRVPFERAGIRRVIIVADGAMHLIPFALLEVGGAPAVERWALSEAPSVALAMDRWTRPLRAPSGPMVALGDPVVRTEGGRTRPLPGAREEVRAVQRRSAGAVVRVGGAASESYLKAMTVAPRLLHVAAHGEVDDWDGRQAALLLSADASNDGRWLAGEIATLPFDDTLVVLSACRTNLGDLIAGEGVAGLTSAFLQAGARTVLATAWRIPDREIVPLVGRFYDGLGAGLTAGAALQAAQVDARRRGAPASVWAAFRLVGDPYLTVSLR
ncbi:MAG: CHAT domain-containing protein, partial [Gemmatimonadetes bacterium]|nr:CHAT domain-containing protein [Gemmatimonadota bacterium]